MVTALIDAGMDPNVRTHSGTPLHEAACFGKPSVVRILLNKGADLYAQDSRRKTVYDLLDEYPEEATRRVRKVIRGRFQAGLLSTDFAGVDGSSVKSTGLISKEVAFYSVLISNLWRQLPTDS